MGFLLRSLAGGICPAFTLAEERDAPGVGYDRRAMSQPAPRPPHKRRRREAARTIGVVILAVLITLFAVLNRESVKVDWIFGSDRAPLIVVILISLLIGILLTHLLERRANKRR